MKRSAERIKAARYHPTEKGIVQLKDERAPEEYGGAIATVYLAGKGEPHEADAEFMVKAWNNHDSLVAALERAKLDGAFKFMSTETIVAVESALAAAGEA